jgi:hypothetical protein
MSTFTRPGQARTVKRAHRSTSPLADCWPWPNCQRRWPPSVFAVLSQSQRRVVIGKRPVTSAPAISSPTPQRFPGTDSIRCCRLSGLSPSFYSCISSKGSRSTPPMCKGHASSKAPCRSPSSNPRAPWIASVQYSVAGGRVLGLDQDGCSYGGTRFRLSVRFLLNDPVQRSVASSFLHAW